jgi:tetratricopeptide (TPR) repeat protein
MAGEHLDIPWTGFDTAVKWLLTGLLAFMPLAFGVVHAWSEEVVMALSSAMVICLLLRCLFHRGCGLRWTWAYIPIVLLLLIVVLQLVPLPVRWISALSPNTVPLKTELLGGLADAGGSWESMTLTFYPHATIHDLRLMLAAVGVFVVVFNVFRDPPQITWLLKAIATIGGLIAAVTLAQYLFGNGRFYWLIPSAHYQGLSGPFVNHSNYGQFMNLSIGAALGLFLVRLGETSRRHETLSRDLPARRMPDSSWPLCLLPVGVALTAATVFLSLTRGGVISMLVAGGFTALLLCTRRSLRGHTWIIVAVILAGFPCVLYAGFDAVYDRLASLQNLRNVEAGRLQILKDIAVIWTRFPIFGTGLGTHSVVYPMHDRSTMVPLAAYAENEYAQVLEETGLLGLGVLVILGGIVWSGYARCVRHGAEPICSAAYGLGFGLLAVLIHSLSDFGQHLPANGVLSATFCALLLVLAGRSQLRISDFGFRIRAAGSIRNLQSAIRNPLSRFPRTVAYSAFLAGVLAVSAWAFVGTHAARRAQSHRRQCVQAEKSLAARNWQGTSGEYAALISHATAACACEPANAQYRYWLNVYRWRWISRVIDPNAAEIAIPDQLMPALHAVVTGFHQACALCPTFGPPYTAVGQIEQFVLFDDRGAQKIRTGYRLAPCDPMSCFVAGYLDVAEGRHDASIEKFTRAVRLDGRLFPEVVDVYLRHLSRPDLAISCAGDDIERLRYVSGILEEMEYVDLAERTLDREKDLLEAKCEAGEAHAREYVYLGMIYKRQGRSEAAISCYRRALELDYGQVEWRLELAELLARTGRVRDALSEARTCLDLRPGCDAAKKLTGEFSLHRTVLDGAVAAP